MNQNSYLKLIFMKKFNLLLLLAMGVSFATAQETETIGDAHVSNYRDWAVGVHVGNMFTAGDLSSFDFSHVVSQFFFHHRRQICISKAKTDISLCILI